MNNEIRVPVNWLSANQDLLKSQATGGAGGPSTDYKQTETIGELATIPDQYRAPEAREHGNVLARRYPNGQLDVDNMKHKVIDALHIVKQGGQLNAIQELALSVLFPTVFMFVDPMMTGALARVNLKITPDEAAMVAQAVADHLMQEHEVLLHFRQ